MIQAPARPAQRPRVGAPAIDVLGLTKSFDLAQDRHSTLRDQVVHPLRGGERQRICSLAGISFSVQPGEVLGVVGHNGSGKTTLLRCLAGIYRPDAGEVHVRGRIAPFLELGGGLDLELTAREAAVLNAVAFGVRPRVARARLPDIFAFAELEDFADVKLRGLSAGMVMRLAFAVTMQVEADVLLFDEVLAVGDEGFKRRCRDHLDRLRAGGRTIVLVSHNLDDIVERCDRALLLEHGMVVASGSPAQIAERHRAATSPAPGGVLLGPGSCPRPSRPPSPSPRRVMALAWVLATSSFRRRYLDSALGYVWASARPVLSFLVMLAVFTQVARLDVSVEHYPAYLLASVVMWSFFAESTGTAVNALVAGGQLLRRLPVPPIALPVAVTLSSLFDLAITTVPVLVFLLATGVNPKPGWFAVPFLLVALAVLTAGASMLLSALFVRLRDIDQVWSLGRQILFLVSPVFYTATAVPQELQRVYLVNPLATLLTEMRRLLIDAQAPSAAELMGGGMWLLAPAALAGALVVGGYLVIRRLSGVIPEHM